MTRTALPAKMYAKKWTWRRQFYLYFFKFVPWSNCTYWDSVRGVLLGPGSAGSNQGPATLRAGVHWRPRR